MSKQSLSAAKAAVKESWQHLSDLRGYLKKLEDIDIPAAEAEFRAKSDRAARIAAEFAPAANRAAEIAALAGQLKDAKAGISGATTAAHVPEAKSLDQLVTEIAGA